MAIWLWLGALLLAGCSGVELKNAPPKDPRICCFGDSLTKGYGAREEEAYPAVLARLTGAEVVNWGVSGETTGDALGRLPKFDKQSFGVVIVTLGGNDILQRVNWKETKANLETIFTKLQERGAVVVFTGVTGPLNPTRGGEYAKMCKAYGVLYIPEILDGLRGHDELMSDEIHPNAAGYRKMAERIFGELQKAKLVGATE